MFITQQWVTQLVASVNYQANTQQLTTRQTSALNIHQNEFCTNLKKQNKTKQLHFSYSQIFIQISCLSESLSQSAEEKRIWMEGKRLL